MSRQLCAQFADADAAVGVGLAEVFGSATTVGRKIIHPLHGKPGANRHRVAREGEVGKDGSQKAAYFNPRPISVARAEWKRKDGALTIIVELRDVNYPGSTYTLQYDPKSDRLKGTYFQAVAKQTFAVEFTRGK